MTRAEEWEPGIGRHISGDRDGVEVRQLWPAWLGRLLVLDHRLDHHPGVGVYTTNGRVIWGLEQAERFADRHREIGGWAVIRVLENGWEEYAVLICRQCRHRLYQPGSAALALAILTEGSCGHPSCPASVTPCG
jgi:hypothetical protein